jgi:curli production assembly/transport component CsgG
MIRTVSVLLLTLLLGGCAGFNTAIIRSIDDPVITIPKLKVEPTLPAPANGPVTIAVYAFRDLTGQRKSQTNVASLSSAVTQGADSYLIKSLQTVGNGEWFKVVERGGMDNLIKERQLIRQMREQYQGNEAQPLPPMIFAGIILEGGIIGYDSNTVSGGNGARLMGIGASTEYRIDEVVISLRAVSVSSGEILSSINVKKTVASVQDKLGVIKFYDLGQQAFELETGSAANESMNQAVQLAIHAAVIELVKDGEKRGLWKYKTLSAAQLQPSPALQNGSIPIPPGRPVVTPPAKVAPKASNVAPSAAPRAPIPVVDAVVIPVEKKPNDLVIETDRKTEIKPATPPTESDNSLPIAPKIEET